jgi:hypothetical protein
MPDESRHWGARCSDPFWRWEIGRGSRTRPHRRPQPVSAPSDPDHAETVRAIPRWVTVAGRRSEFVDRLACGKTGMAEPAPVVVRRAPGDVIATDSLVTTDVGQCDLLAVALRVSRSPRRVDRARDHVARQIRAPRRLPVELSLGNERLSGLRLQVGRIRDAPCLCGHLLRLGRQTAHPPCHEPVKIAADT